MRILKRIEFGLDIYDPIALYDDPNYLMDILVSRFEGKCYKSCYIEKIVRIIPELQSDCNITCDGNPTFGTIGVICEVNAIVYQPGEVINGCVVNNRSATGVILCSTSIANIMLDSHASLASIVKGQIISVRVGGTKYVISGNKISVNAIPYLINPAPIIYKVDPTAKLNPAIFTDVFERIAEEEAHMKSLQKHDAKAWATFDSLMYAYKEEPKAKVKEIPLDALLHANNLQYVCRDPCIVPSRKVMYAYTIDEIPENVRVKSVIPTEAVQLMMLEDYCAHLRNIREMIDIYSTPELLTTHKNLWMIFKRNKL